MYEKNICEIELKLKRTKVENFKVTNSKDIYDFLKNVYDEDTLCLYESCFVIYFDNSLKSIGWFKHSSGGMCASIIDPKLVIGTALKIGATAIALTHNHPSGSLTPSSEDIRVTEKIKNACGFLDLTLIDHIIYTQENGYYSFADNSRI